MFYAKNKETGMLTHISDVVVRGLGCNCVCLDCGADLEAKKGPIRDDHFCHSKHTSCNPTPESILHKAAKAILREAKHVYLPPDHNYKGCETVYFDKVKEEYKLEQFFIDVTGMLADERIHVEIAVTHLTTDRDKIKALQIDGSAIEIDLSGIDRNISKESLIDVVIKSAPRKWLAYRVHGLRSFISNRNLSTQNLTFEYHPATFLSHHSWKSRKRWSKYSKEYVQDVLCALKFDKDLTLQKSLIEFF